MMLKKFKYNDIQQCHFLNNKNNIKLYYTYKKNKYFINLEKNTSTQSFILEINSAERSFSTVKLNCQNSKSEIVIVMLPKYVSALLAEEIDLSGYFLTVCIHRNFSSFICITPDMLNMYPNGYANSIRIIIEINGERIDEIHKFPFCRAMAIKRKSLTTVI